MRVLRFNVSPLCFPRYNYALTKISSFYNRYNDIKIKFHCLAENITSRSAKQLELCICGKETEKPVSFGIEDIILKRKGIEEHATVTTISLCDFLNEKTQTENQIQILVLDSKMLDEIRTLCQCKTRFVVIAKDKSEIQLMKKEETLQNSLNALLTTKKTAAQDISNWLEQIALRPMKQMCEFLDRVLKRKDFEISTKHQCSTSNLKYCDNTSELANIMLRKDTKSSDKTEAENNCEVEHQDGYIYRDFAKTNLSQDQIVEHDLTQKRPRAGLRFLKGQTKRLKASIKDEEGTLIKPISRNQTFKCDCIRGRLRSRYPKVQAKRVKVPPKSGEGNVMINIPQDQAFKCSCTRKRPRSSCSKWQTKRFKEKGKKDAEGDRSVYVSSHQTSEGNSTRRRRTGTKYLKKQTQRFIEMDQNAAEGDIWLYASSHRNSEGNSTRRRTGSKYLKEQTRRFNEMGQNDAEGDISLYASSHQNSEGNSTGKRTGPKYVKGRTKQFNETDKNDAEDDITVYASSQQNSKCNSTRKRSGSKYDKRQTKWFKRSEENDEGDLLTKVSFHQNFEDGQPNLRTYSLTETVTKDIDEETVANLLQEMLAVYSMSTVPPFERPIIAECDEEEISKSTKRKIFAANKTVTGIGYRMNKLHVFVKNLKDETADALRTSQIHEVLKQLRIQNYNIIPVEDKIKELMYVGAKIHPRYTYGTLGCYAEMSDGHRCILLSKHVAKQDDSIYCLDQNKKIATVIPETSAGNCEVDIAAAVIDTDVYECCTQFKDSKGNKVKGKLFEYNCDTDKHVIMEGQAVHIWGATSTPGNGVISMQKYEIETDSFPLIQIRDGKNRFAEGGDSGAIVCVEHPDDDFVYAVGMVIGEHVQKGPKQQTFYVALPLSEGIRQLEKVTGKTFTLC